MQYSTTNKKEYFKNKDLPRIAFLVVKGFNCIGSVEDKTDPRGLRKLFVIEYDKSEEDELLALEKEFVAGDSELAQFATAFYRAQKTIKRYIPDSEIRLRIGL